MCVCVCVCVCVCLYLHIFCFIFFVDKISRFIELFLGYYRAVIAFIVPLLTPAFLCFSNYHTNTKCQENTCENICENIQERTFQ